MAYNRIEIQKIHYIYEQSHHEADLYHCCIDGKSMPEYLQMWSAEYPEDKTVKMMSPFTDLCSAWSKDLEWEGDVRFVWKTLELNRAVLPLLLCPEDTDFSCIVVVAEVEKTEDTVRWNKVGYVLHTGEDFNEEKKSGILNLKSYSDEDWEKYGDNIALEEADSPAWRQWISENWTEELYRRRMNYTLPFYQTEGNVFWMKETDWVFDRDEYENMVEEYWEIATWEMLKQYKPREKLSAKGAADLIASLERHGWESLDRHLEDYGEILLHVFAGECVSEPLLCLLNKTPLPERRIRAYCRVIEILWRYGDEAVVNVVDVTILERLSDEDVLWQRFGTFLSEEFKTYINEEVLTHNAMMWGVKPL